MISLWHHIKVGTREPGLVGALFWGLWGEANWGTRKVFLKGNLFLGVDSQLKILLILLGVW